MGWNSLICHIRWSSCFKKKRRHLAWATLILIKRMFWICILKNRSESRFIYSSFLLPNKWSSLILVCLDHFWPSISLQYQALFPQCCPGMNSSINCGPNHTNVLLSLNSFSYSSCSYLAHTQSLTTEPVTPSVICRIILWVKLDDFCWTFVEIWNGFLSMLTVYLEKVPQEEFWICLVYPIDESAKIWQNCLKIFLMVVLILNNFPDNRKWGFLLQKNNF